MDTPIRKSLCADSLISTIYQHFQKIPDPRGIQNKPSISFTDVLMSGFAVFGLKFPSLLQYDQNRQILDQNLLNLYHISRPPSDTYLRERFDELEPSFTRPAFKKIFAQLQRGKCLEGFEFLDEYYLLSLDGTGEFSSGEICCPQCCKKEHKRFIYIDYNGEVIPCTRTFSPGHFRLFSILQQWDLVLTHKSYQPGVL